MAALKPDSWERAVSDGRSHFVVFNAISNFTSLPALVMLPAAKVVKILLVVVGAMMPELEVDILKRPSRRICADFD